jgi:hypothetical protein
MVNVESRDMSKKMVLRIAAVLISRVLIENNLSRIYTAYCDISESRNDKGENPSVNRSKRFVHVYKMSSVKK